MNTVVADRLPRLVVAGTHSGVGKTSVSTPEEGALAIKAAAEQNQWSRAFSQLKETLTVEPLD
jgi:hypothetical protein